MKKKIEETIDGKKVVANYEGRAFGCPQFWVYVDGKRLGWSANSAAAAIARYKMEESNG